MFRRPSVHYGSSPPPDTPYARARQAWDRRIGEVAVVGRRVWLLALVEGLAIAALGGALAWTTARGSVTPWVVEVDRLGQARAVTPAVADYQPTDPQIAFHLGRFIEQVRAIPADPIVLRENWLRAYDFATARGALALNDYARQADPFGQVGKRQVAVDVSSVIRASPASFRVAWTERHYVDGALADTQRWSAIVTLIIRPPRDADRLRKNPLGIYVTAIDWSKELAP